MPTRNVTRTVTRTVTRQVVQHDVRGRQVAGRLCYDAVSLSPEPDSRCYGQAGRAAAIRISEAARLASVLRESSSLPRMRSRADMVLSA